MKQIKKSLFPLLTIVFLGILFGYYLYQKKGIEILKEKADKLDSKIVQGQERFKDIKFVRKTATIRKRVSLPRVVRVSQFLEHLTRLSKDCQVNLNSLVIEPIEKTESLSQLSLKIDFSSQYSKLVEYLERVKTPATLFTIDSLNLKSENPPVLEGSLAATIYLLPYEVKSNQISKAQFDWRRDPFLLPGGKKKFSETAAPLELTGIIWDKEHPMAIINGRIVTIGDLVAERKVMEIDIAQVVLGQGDKRYLLDIESKNLKQMYDSLSVPIR